MSILNYVLADKEKKARLREGYADVLKHSNTYRLGAGIGNLAGDAVTGVKDFASDITFNPLPYDEYARSVYDGIQNSYGGWLDDKYDAVADWYNPVTTRWNEDWLNPNPQPDMMAGGPMSRNGYRHHPGVPVPLDEYPSRHANPHAQVTIDNTPSHLIPGFDRMVNEGYDSWSPSDVDNYNNREYNIMRHGMDYPVDNRSDWQKWKDSVNSGRR
jgi:hypothetical protein